MCRSVLYAESRRLTRPRVGRGLWLAAEGQRSHMVEGVVRPETKYAKSGDVHIAYQVVGDGPIDLVMVNGWVSHIEYQWENPAWARALLRLASFSRLIIFDKWGTWMSDRVSESALPGLEQRMDDLRAVMEEVGSDRAALFGTSEGAAMSLLFASTYPNLTTALVLYGSNPVRRWSGAPASARRRTPSWQGWRRTAHRRWRVARRR